MFDQSVLSLWSSINSWLTPTVLFLLLNLTIATIVFASASTPKNQTHQDQHHQGGLVRSNSVLQRLKSINFYSYKSDQSHQTESAEETKLVRSPSILQRLQSVKFHFHFQTPETEIGYNHTQSELLEEQDQTQQTETGHNNTTEIVEDQTLDEVYSQLQERHHHHHHVRTTSETKPASGEVMRKLPKKMKKSASAKSAFAHFEAEEVERRRPATVKEKHDEEDEEVDAKCDDFINRFKQQLKLQRIDSIIRYKEMITNRSNDVGK